jgi:hypothetical protein
MVFAQTLSALHSLNAYTPGRMIATDIPCQENPVHEAGRYLVCFWVLGWIYRPSDEIAEAKVQEADLIGGLTSHCHTDSGTWSYLLRSVS